MFRREALEAVGGFNPEIRLEDVYICLSILKACLLYTSRCV